MKKPKSDYTQNGKTNFTKHKKLEENNFQENQQGQTESASEESLLSTKCYPPGSEASREVA